VKAVGGGKTGTKQFSLKVTEPMRPTPPAAKAIKLGRQFLVAFAVKGGLGPYRWSGVGLPAGVGVNPTTGQAGGRPKQPGPLTVTVKVTDSLGTSLSASTTVTAATKLTITTATLPVARSGKRYRAALRTAGGANPVSLRLAGPRPAWLSFGARTGKLTGHAEAEAAEAARGPETHDARRQAARAEAPAARSVLHHLRHCDGCARAAEHEEAEADGPAALLTPRPTAGGAQESRL
jgi:Putative Ig domain